jgi:hypothetical protein
VNPVWIVGQAAQRPEEKPNLDVFSTYLAARERAAQMLSYPGDALSREAYVRLYDREEGSTSPAYFYDQRELILWIECVQLDAAASVKCIRINGEPVNTLASSHSYDELVEMASLCGYPSCVWRTKDGKSGILVPDRRVDISDGMSFTIINTDNA